MSFDHVPNFVGNSVRKAELPQHKPGSPSENWCIPTTSQLHHVWIGLALFAWRLASNSKSMPLAIKFQINTQKTQIRAGTFICFVAPVKKIYGVPPPRFNLLSEVLALFHHDWSRFPIFDIKMFINMMHIKRFPRQANLLLPTQN